MPEPKEAVETEVKEETTETKDVSDILDAELDKAEKETPSERSTEKEPTGKEAEPKEEGADLPKEAKPEGEEKESEKDDPKDLMFRRGYNEAKSKFDKEREGMPSKDDVENFSKVTSSPAYIRFSMQEQGFKDEAINKELTRLGHEVPDKPTDDVALVAAKLGIDPKRLDDNMRATIEDVSKIARIINEDSLGKVLPGQLKPLQDAQIKSEQESTGQKLYQGMQDVVKKDNILDFKEDIAPELDKWMKENPEAHQGDIQEFFKDLNHRLSIERLKTGGKKKKRDESKGNLRNNREGAVRTGNLPEKTGDFDKDFDAAADSMNLT